MKRTRRVEITVHERRVVLLRSQRPLSSGCPRCGDEAPLATPEESAAIAGVVPAAVVRWIAAGLVHSFEKDGQPLVCLASLPLSPTAFDP
jgi:hypothetical protein